MLTKGGPQCKLWVQGPWHREEFSPGNKDHWYLIQSYNRPCPGLSFIYLQLPKVWIRVVFPPCLCLTMEKSLQGTVPLGMGKGSAVSATQSEAEVKVGNIGAGINLSTVKAEPSWGCKRENHILPTKQMSRYPSSVGCG